MEADVTSGIKNITAKCQFEALYLVTNMPLITSVKA